MTCHAMWMFADILVNTADKRKLWAVWGMVISW